MSESKVVILGGGPAGVGAAYQLRRRGRASVTLLEQQNVVGGNAGSFEAGGIHLDYGSHRLHSACDPEILEDIQRLLKGDLGFYARHGRIRLRGKYLHFPLKPLDLLLRLDRGFALGVGFDMVRRALPGKNGAGNTFASVVRANLGPTISEHFYFPYARKIWGRDPEELSGTSAQKRVSAGTFKKIMRRLVKPPGKGGYYYPRRGYGQISEVYADAARELGANLMLGWRVSSVEQSSNGQAGWTVIAERNGEKREINADHVWSTLPTALLARMMKRPEVPADVLQAAGKMEYRAMILVYLHVPVDQFTTTDAHYFPEENVVFTRVSEPKNYARSKEPKGHTTLCAELPCTVGDELWNMSDEALGQRVADDLAKVDLALPRPHTGVIVKRLSHAYPIYTQGYEVPFERLDNWAASLPNLLVYGRQGLFAHDNTHHALYMAYAATDCLENGTFDHDKWNGYRKIFSTHVVED
jgi:protoporphyrinogen oxidase